MSFLAPAFLWALPFIAAPILIHLYNRRRTREIHWGAMEFLRVSAAPQRRMRRWRELLLMLLRASVIATIIAALAQPVASLFGLGSSGPRDVIVIMDNSLSTTRTIGDSKAFNQITAAASKFVEQLGRGDAVRVLSASPSPAWLISEPVNATPSGKREIVGRLNGLAANDGSADLVDCILQAARLERSREGAARLVAVVSDGQAHAWRTNTPQRWAAIKSAVEKAGPDAMVRVIKAIDEPESPLNLAVTEITALRDVLGAGQSAALSATIQNTGKRPTEQSTLSWSADGQAIGLSAIPPLQPGARISVSLTEPFATPGLREVRCELNSSDDIGGDNHATRLIEVRDRIPVLVVSGEPSADLTASDTGYLVAALGGGRSAASAFEPTEVEFKSLRSVPWRSFACVILANVPQLETETVKRLKSYVRNGGGLWMGLGDQVDLAWFNDVLHEGESGLAPLALAEATGDALDRERGVRVRPPEAAHRATALLANAALSDIDRTRIYRRFRFTAAPLPSTTALLRAEGGDPFAVEKSYGRGRVIVQAAPFGISWSNLPLNQSFVIMVHEWLWHLTAPGTARRNLEPGATIEFAANASEWRSGASILFPDGASSPILAREEDGTLIFKRVAAQAGDYRLTMTANEGGERRERFLVSRSPEESDLTLLTPAQTEEIAQLSGIRFDTLQNGSVPGERGVATPEPAAESLLWLLAGLLAAEGILAYMIFLSRRTALAPAEMAP